MWPDIDHDLDVEGDVLLVLQNPNEPFAIWDAEEDWELPQPKFPGIDNPQTQKYRFHDPAYRADCRLSMESSSEMAEAPETIERGEPQQKKLKTIPVAGGSSEIRFRLSSRHLILASPYFRATLTGPWEENSSRSDTMYTTKASDWDEEALIILMDIIHGHSEKIPRSISLDLLAKIAVLVDYYKCHKVVKFYSDTWIEGGLNPDGLGLPFEYRRYSRDFVLLLFVSYVFTQHETFQTLTGLAVEQTQGPLRTLGLPFPAGLIEKIDHARMAVVDVIQGHYHDLVGYLGARNCCGEYLCSSILLGQLVREMMAQGIFNPRPSRPFLGFSVAEAIRTTRVIEAPKWKAIRSSSSSHRCYLRSFFVDLEFDLRGLDLHDFVKQS